MSRTRRPHQRAQTRHGTPRAVHLLVEPSYRLDGVRHHGRTACGRDAEAPPVEGSTTTDPAKVTCRGCQKENR